MGEGLDELFKEIKVENGHFTPKELESPMNKIQE